MSKKLVFQENTMMGNCKFLKETFESSTSQRYGLFQCSCGKIFEGNIYRFNSGANKSCGCVRSSHATQLGFEHRTHGHSSHPLYQVWNNMLTRCYNSNTKDFYRYGGRGVIVCDRWKNSIDNFIEDMHSTYTENLQLDRINNNGNYEPSNCRWVTPKENCMNRCSNLKVNYQGNEYNMMALCEELNINYKTFHMGVTKYNFTIDKAVTLGLKRNKLKQISYK